MTKIGKEITKKKERRDNGGDEGEGKEVREEEKKREEKKREEEKRREERRSSFLSFFLFNFTWSAFVGEGGQAEEGDRVLPDPHCSQRERKEPDREKKEERKSWPGPREPITFTLHNNNKKNINNREILGSTGMLVSRSRLIKTTYTPILEAPKFK